jgi:hypothetical protein
MLDVAEPISASQRPVRRPFRRLGTWSGIALLIAAVCFLDSRAVAARLPYGGPWLGQWLANVMMIAVFLWVRRDAPPLLRRLMEAGLLMATAGEVFFSLVVGMYEYRLANIPLYVPPGHSLLYAAVYYFIREPWVMRNRRWFAPLMLTAGVGYSAVWLIARSDVYGALCTALYVYLIWRHKESRMFFLAMFLLVAYLEQVGTSFGCWYWPAALLDKFALIPSGNPPSGISVFYFGFDVGCLMILGWRFPEFARRYERLKVHREQRLAPAPVAEGSEGLTAAE